MTEENKTITPVQEEEEKEEKAPVQEEKENKADGGPEEKPEKKFSQEELDAVVSNRLERARKKWQEEVNDMKSKADMDEVQRLKYEKEQAEKAVQEVSTTANLKLIKAEAKAQALYLGVAPKKINYALKLANLREDMVNEEGELDEKEIKKALKEVLEDLPELAEAQNPKGGQDFSKETKKGITKEQFQKMSYKERVELKSTNPEFYEKLIKN